MMKKRTFKKEDNKRKNIKHGNLVNNEKVKEIQNKKKREKAMGDDDDDDEPWWWTQTAIKNRGQQKEISKTCFPYCWWKRADEDIRENSEESYAW